jgi:hypothetical protein
MKVLVIGLAALTSLSVFANEPLKVLSCSGKGVSYTVTLTSEFAPSSRILTNIDLTKFQVNPDGTARIESDEEAVYEDQIFDNAGKALKYFKNNDVSLKSADGAVLVLSVKKSTLTVLDLDTKISKTLPCR